MPDIVRSGIGHLLKYVDLGPKTTRAARLSPYEQNTLDFCERRLAACKSLEAAVDFLFGSVQDLCHCDRLGIAFLDSGGRRAVADHMRAAYEPTFLNKGYAADLRQSSLWHVLSLRRPRIISDLQQYAEKRPDSASTKLILREGALSSMTVPLMIQGMVVGLLFCSSRRARAYNERQALLLQNAADQLSKAVLKRRPNANAYYRPV